MVVPQIIRSHLQGTMLKTYHAILRKETNNFKKKLKLTIK